MTDACRRKCLTLQSSSRDIDLPAAHNVQQHYCGSTEFFANLSSSGALIPGYNLETSANATELTTNIDDAAILAF
jgi:hypothetical protein